MLGHKNVTSVLRKIKSRIKYLLYMLRLKAQLFGISHPVGEIKCKFFFQTRN